MTTPKRPYEEVDPDYASTCEQQTKRQRELEQDAKQIVCRRILNIVRNEFHKEISDREMELHLVDRRLNEARLMLDRLRACIVSSYYGQARQPGGSETSSAHGLPPSIHPALKKLLGKRPANYETVSDPSKSLSQASGPSKSQLQSQSSARWDPSPPEDGAEECSERSLGTKEQERKPKMMPTVPVAEASYDDRRARLKVKKKIIVGNVSKYISVDHREANDMSSHKWMVYVRGPKSEPDISGYVKKVWFFLHHSYKPNDLVEISSPPFYLTRRGWGEFPVRVQLHFVDSRNKKVDIIHQLKLDKTFSGLQTLGAETVIELDLEKDFFDSDNNGSNNNFRLTPSSVLNQVTTPSGSVFRETVTEFRNLGHPQDGRGLLSEQSWSILPKELATNQSVEDESSDTDIMDVSSTCNRKEDSQSYVDGITDMSPCTDDIESLTCASEKSMEYSQEYNIAIDHDMDDVEDPTLKESIRTAKNEAECDKLDLVTEIVTSEPETVIPAATVQEQSSQTATKLAATVPSNTFTVITRPKWVSAEHSYTTDKNDAIMQIPNLSSQSKSQVNTSDKNILVPVTTKIPQFSIQSKPQLGTSDSFKVKSSGQVINVVSGTSSVKNCTKITDTLLEMTSNVSGVLNGCVLKQPPANAVHFPPTVTLSSSVSLSSSILASKATKILRIPVTSSREPSSQMSSSLPQLTSCTVLQTTTSSGSPVISLHQNLKENQSLVYPSEKTVIVKSSSLGIASQRVPSSSACESMSLLQPKPGGPRQVSLLTGRVFTPQTSSTSVNQISLTNQKRTESIQNCKYVVKEQTDQLVAPAKATNQITTLISKAANQILLLRPAKQSLASVSSSSSDLTNRTSNDLMNGSLGEVSSPGIMNVSLINPGTSVPSIKKQVSLLKNSLFIHDPNSQISQQTPAVANIILQVHDQGHSQTVSDQNLSAYPKMSAIGLTKHGRNQGNVPRLSTDLKLATDEERKRSQYEVLMAWKRNRHLYEETYGKSKKIMKIQKDTIDGKVDIIPELNLDNYTSMGALLKAAVRLHPVIQAGVNKLTHPYCAESLQQWNSWAVGKQLASEWHRACFVLKYLRTLLEKSGQFRGEHLMTTRQLVHWCRHHAFSPCVTAVKIKQEAADDSSHEIKESVCSPHHFPSFTLAETLDKAISVDCLAARVEDDSMQEVNVMDVVDTADRNSLQKIILTKADTCSTDQSLEWIPPSEGGVFITEQLRKRGIKLQPVELEPGVMTSTPADMLYMGMQEFCADVLREALAVSKWQSPQSPCLEITRRDIHEALTQLPEAGFICNRFLGKTDASRDSSDR